ncbi:MAG: 4Fe-4S binding protein [Planctomycetes bacterium]|nr:4Fe-4S binding protein [Planctomycetota bacterium]
MIRRVGRSGRARRATALLFLGAIALGGRAEVAWFRGSTTSSEVAGLLRLTDPLAALEVSLASGAALPIGALVGVAILVAVAALLGPVFCGWLCPVGLLLDLQASVRGRVERRLLKRGRKLPEHRAPRELAFAVLGAALGFSWVAGLPAFQLVSPVNLVAWAVAFAVGPALVLVLGVLLLDWIAPRLWCRSLCPLGLVYALLGHFAVLRVRIDRERAGVRPCGHCTVHCPMGLRVMEEYVSAGQQSVRTGTCTRCGACVDACPRGVLSLGFGVPGRRRSATGGVAA